MEVKKLIKFTLIAVFYSIVGLETANADWVGYPNWSRGTMSATESSDLGGYPATNLVDDWGDTVPRAGFCPDSGGFGLRDDYHGSWHSSAEFIGTTTVSPSGTVTREWLSFYFGQVYELTSIDFWNFNMAGVTGRGIKDISIDVSYDGTNWITVWTGQISQAPGTLTETLPGSCANNMYGGRTGVSKQTTVELSSLPIALYVVINAQTNWGFDGYFACDEIRFYGTPTTLPVPAHSPDPANNDTCLDIGTNLSWALDTDANSYDVYFGSDFNDVTNAALPAGDVDGDIQVDMNDLYILVQQWLTDPGASQPSADIYDDNTVNFRDFAVIGKDWKLSNTIFRGNFTANSYDPGILESCNNYYWRVDKVINGTRIKGAPWSFSTCCGGTAGSEYYVAVDGNDNNPGTITEPFRTLEKARDVLECKCLQDGGTTVYLRGGKYFRENQFTLGSENSGAPGKPIIYKAYPGEEVRLIGGLQLDPNWFSTTSGSPVWSRLDVGAQGNVMECNLAAHNITDYGQLTHNGAPDGRKIELSFNGNIMQLARWPNEGYEDFASVINSTTFAYNGTRPSRWTNASDPWTSGYWMYGWHLTYNAISSIDTINSRITLAVAPSYGDIFSNGEWCALNLLEEIDSAGEWYLERDTGILYFWPPSDISSSEILVSKLGSNNERMVQTNGTSYVTFEDITFEMARYIIVQLIEGSNILFDNCVIRNVGEYGIIVGGGSNHGVHNCELYGTGATGIYLSGGDRPTLTPSGHFVRNSNIYDFTRWRRANYPGIQVAGVGCEVTNNVLSDAPHSAIFYHGNDHLLQNNEIYNVCYETDDAGAIMSDRDWGHRGNVVRNNFIHHIDSPSNFTLGVHAIYYDSCTCGHEVFGNVFYEVTGNTVFVNGGRDNITENNIFARCGYAHATSRGGLAWINEIPGNSFNLLEKIEAVNYTQPPWSTAYPELASILDEGYEQAKEPKGNVIRRNIGWLNGQWLHEYCLPSCGGFGFYTIENNIQNQNPLFVDEAALNLALRDDSPAYAIPGFVRIPFESIGLLSTTKATRPNPSNEKTGVSTTPTLYWAEAFQSTSRDVYFGSIFADVNNANTSSGAFKVNTTDYEYSPSSLSAGSTYYWRIDERNADGVMGKGDVWSFTTAP